MKKIFVILAMTLFSLNVFADSRSCQVYGHNEVTVSLVNPVSTADRYSGSARATVKLSSSINEAIHVAVSCYDMSGNYIDTREIIIDAYEKQGAALFTSLQKGKVYQFKIASASCK